MLVLSRKRDEVLLVGSGVRITVVGIAGDRVRLGIEAPGDVPIWREEVVRRAPEVLDRKREEGKIPA